MTAIYFVGASGVGKSTLANALSEVTRVGMLQSAARRVASAMNITNFTTLLSSQTEYAEYQKRVMLEQIRMENEAAKVGDFISDRAFDHLAYNAIYGSTLHSTFMSEDFNNYMAKFKKSPESHIVFFIRPTVAAWVAAKSEGKRSEFLVWDDMMRFDGALKFLMELLEVNYFEINANSVGDRLKQVQAILKCHGFTKSQTIKLKPIGTSPGITKSILGNTGEDQAPKCDYIRITLPSGEQFAYRLDFAVHAMREWMKANNRTLDSLNIGDMPKDSPAVTFGMNNYGINAVMDELHGRPKNPQNYQCVKGLPLHSPYTGPIPRSGQMIVQKPDGTYTISQAAVNES